MHRGVSEKISGVIGEWQRIFKPLSLYTAAHRQGGNTACVFGSVCDPGSPVT